jgi:S-adenosyl methyltransferase
VVKEWNRYGKPEVRLRGPEDVLGWFSANGVELLDPGVVSCTEWRPVGQRRRGA